MKRDIQGHEHALWNMKCNLEVGKRSLLDLQNRVAWEEKRVIFLEFQIEVAKKQGKATFDDEFFMVKKKGEKSDVQP